METNAPRSAVSRYLDVAATIAVIVAAAALVVALAAGRSEGTSEGRPPRKTKLLPVPSEPLSLAGAHTQGTTSAPLVVVEFADFQCPACAMFAKKVFPGFSEKYVRQGLVLYAFRHLPLDTIHPLAIKAAQAAECAGQQGRFAEMSRELFAVSPQLEEARIAEISNRLGIGNSEFKACSTGEVNATIKDAAAAAQALSITSIPAFFFGTLQADGSVKVLATSSGATRTPEAFYDLLDAQLRAITQK